MPIKANTQFNLIDIKICKKLRFRRYQNLEAEAAAFDPCLTHQLLYKLAALKVNLWPVQDGRIDRYKIIVGQKDGQRGQNIVLPFCMKMRPITLLRKRRKLACFIKIDLSNLFSTFSFIICHQYKNKLQIFVNYILLPIILRLAC